MSLKGKRELQARFKALKTVFKPIGREWGREDVKQSRSRIPVRTGRLRRSVRVTSATQTRTRVGAFYTAYFVDKGPKAHNITAKHGKVVAFPGSGGRAVFSRQVHHRGYRGRPFRQRSAEEALRLTPAASIVIKAWNKAKGIR